LTELLGEVLGGKPRHHVGIPAGDERHHDGHRPRRPVVARVRHAGRQREQGETDCEAKSSEAKSSEAMQKSPQARRAPARRLLERRCAY